jgi:transcriptional regulator with XRE-family HTH domain
MTSSSNQSIGAVIRAARNLAGWTQHQLGQACAIAQSSISRIERGEHTPTIAERRAIALALKINLSTLGVGDDSEASELKCSPG